MFDLFANTYFVFIISIESEIFSSYQKTRTPAEGVLNIIQGELQMGSLALALSTNKGTFASTRLTVWSTGRKALISIYFSELSVKR